MTRLRYFLIATAATGIMGVGIVSASPMFSAFPHEKHERLFPVCEGCHAGVASGSASEVYPAPADCAQCHDGTRVKVVEWRPPSKRVSNIRFSHSEHAASTASAGDSATCQSCHATAGAVKRMDVGAPQPTRCIQCHTHKVETHLAATAACTSCHVPLAQATGLPQARVANLPRPAWHEGPAFLSEHGRYQPPQAASCTVCHARQTCERCHANATRLPRVSALAPDARVAALERGRKPEYPMPASHRGDDWRSIHADSARRAPATCANCHTRPSCTSCHLGGVGAASSAIASLPPARAGGAPGVVVDRAG